MNRNHVRPRRWALAALMAASLTAACRDEPLAPEQKHNADWRRVSHGQVAPNYAVVFPQASVNTIEIAMTAAQWAAIRENMKAIVGADFGAMPGPGPEPGPAPGPPGGSPPGEDPPGDEFDLPDPDYVDVTLTFNGKVWKNVGFRLKGNSSLVSSWMEGIYKLPFRLDMDEFEDEQPGVRDQRFYGFKELSFSPGQADASLIRDKAASDIFRMAGVPAARTAFYRVYIDFGEGKKYCGVYTAVEVIDDTMVRSQFGEDHGNLYKPESTFREFALDEWEKKNNRAGSYADAQAAIAALNSPLRTSNPAAWRANLEAVFNVDHFLRWLAVNNTIVNWDTYGALAHNFYLYNHSTAKLTWIPWDHNLSLEGNPGITKEPVDLPPPGPAPRAAGLTPAPRPGGDLGLSLTMNEVGDEWPLLRYLADDPVYFARYRAHMKTFVNTVFTEPKMNQMFGAYHGLIAPHVVGANGEQPGYTHLGSPDDFTAALADLRAHVQRRRALAAEFLQ